MPTIQEYRTEFSKLHTEATAIVDGALAADRELTSDEKTANESRFSRMNAIKATLDEQLKFAKLAIEGAPEAKGTVQLPTDVPGKAEFEASKAGEKFDAANASDRQAFSDALSRWASTGEMDRRFATITTATSNGALLPRQIAMPIVPTSSNVIRDAMAIYGLAPVVTQTTANLNVPVMDATAGGVVAENATADTDNAPSLAESIALNVKTYQSGTAWFSNQQLAATDYDITTEALPALLYSKELGLESALIAALIADSGVTQGITLTGITSAGLTYAKLVSLNRALPKRYDRQKVIVLSRDAFTAAEGLTDSQNRPVLVPDPQNGELLRFNGTPVLRSDYLDAFGATKTVGFVASLMGFKIRDAGQVNLARYVNQPTKPNQSGFNAFSYHGYGWAPSAVAKLVTSAS